MVVKEDATKPAGKLRFKELELTALPGAWHAWDCLKSDWMFRVLECTEFQGAKATAAQMQLLLFADRKIHEIWLNSPWFEFESDGWLAWFFVPPLSAVEKYTLEKLKSVDNGSAKS